MQTVKVPTSSPWGRPQSCRKIVDLVYVVSTAGHGGILVHSSLANKMSDYARNIAGEVCCGGEFLAFEEDCNWVFPYFELNIPFKDQDALISTLCHWHPKYADNAEFRSHLTSEQNEHLDKSLLSVSQEEERQRLLDKKDPHLVVAARSMKTLSDYKSVLGVEASTPQELLSGLAKCGEVFNDNAILDLNQSLCVVWTADDRQHIVDDYASARQRLDVIITLKDCGNLVYSSNK